MTRGQKGCYIYFIDKETEKLFKSGIINQELGIEGQKSNYHDIEINDELESLPSRSVADINDSEKYQEYLPVYSLKAAAGKFGEGSDVHEEGWMMVIDIGKYW